MKLNEITETYVWLLFVGGEHKGRFETIKGVFTSENSAKVANHENYGNFKIVKVRLNKFINVANVD